MVFDAAGAPARQYPTNQGACPAWSYAKYKNLSTNAAQVMRCDDAQDLSPLGNTTYLGAPQLQALNVLNDAKVYVRTSGTADFYTPALRDYELSYDQTPSSTSTNAIADPASGLKESVAGALLLTRIQEVGDDGATALPPLTMSYTSGMYATEYYVDSYVTHPAGGNCGPAWNTSNCFLWSQTYNSYYLSELDNGRGWIEQYNWNDAHNNTHGVNGGMTLNDPFACDDGAGGLQTTGVCAEADDENWSRIVLTWRRASEKCVALNQSGCGNAGLGSDTLQSTWSYAYTLTDNLRNVECPGCSQGMYWGNMNDGDKLDYYNATFVGFATATITNPDGAIQYDAYYTTAGYGLWSNSVTCLAYSGSCGVSPWTDPNNALHGHMREELDYSPSWALLREHTYFYNVACPAAGVSASPHGTYTGQLSSELDQLGNPIVDCSIDTSQEEVYQPDGGSAATAPTASTTYTYTRDSGGHLTKLETARTSSNGGAHGSPTALTDITEYTWHDAVTPTPTTATGTYLLELPAYEAETDASEAPRPGCVLRGYDGQAASTGSDGALTQGLLTSETHYATQCGTAANGWTYTGPLTTTYTYDGYGNAITTDDPDANGGVTGHTGCASGGTNYTACAGYDPTFGSLLIWTKNALNQISRADYPTSQNPGSPAAAAGNGWGQWLPALTDANGQTTSFTYDPLGRLTSTTLPGETSGDTTTADAYPVTCAATGAQEPCVGLASTQRLDGIQSGDTVTSATYYDGWGRTVETVTPAPGGTGGACDYTVRYTLYDPSGRTQFVSDPYITGQLCPNGTTPPYFRPDTSQAGTSYTYDGLGRTLTTTDPLSETTTTSYTQGQPQGANVNDTGYYEQTTTVDANAHQRATLADALGRSAYAETFTGNSTSTYAIYATSTETYDLLGDTTAVYGPSTTSAGLSTTAQSTATYDSAGRQSGLTDADLGSYTYTRDPNGNLTESVDGRGAAGTVYAAYDGLNRQLWRNTSNSPTGAYATYSYDSTTGGNDGVGRLTGETFNAGATLGAGSYANTYGARGQLTADTVVLDGGSYPLSFGYNDAGMPTTTTYSDGEVATTSYTAQGWPSGLATVLSGVQTNILTALAYTGVGGAAAHPTAATVANGTYSASASYDNDLRLTSQQLTDGGTTEFAQTRGYDNVGDVTSASTTLPAGTDSQAFCYDEQNRLTWASAATATGPCGAANTAGTLTAASYTSTYTYDARTRLTGVGGSGAASFSFGSGLPGTAPLDGVAANGSASYSYDAAGDRTNAGATTGDIYDAERRLVSWSITGGSGKEAYDGEGHRVAHSTTSGITTTTTYYVGTLEEVDATSGAVTKYYPTPAGTPAALRVGTSGVTYLATDGLGSVSEALDGSGNVIATHLFGPYGQTRYSTGTMPTTKGYTGQRLDAASGLYYYNARYYDPATDQFASADSAAAGLNRYAYVAGNPETATDPTGHRIACGPDDGCGGGTGSGGSSGGTGPSNGCTSDSNCGGCYSSCGGTGNGTGDGHKATRDKHGKCLDYATCDQDKSAAAKALRNKYNWDEGIGAVLVLIGNLARMVLDKDNPLLEFEDILNFATAVGTLLPSLMSALFGAGSELADVALQAAKSANALAAGMRALEAAGYGLKVALWLITPVYNGLMAATLGPLDIAMDVVAKAAGGAILNMGIAYGYSRLNDAMDDQNKLQAIATETVPQWCQSNAGACGTTSFTS